MGGAEEKSEVAQVENTNNNGEEPETKPTAKSSKSDLPLKVKPIDVLKMSNCVPLIELAITKYIASNGLPSIYKAFKTVKLEDLLSGVNNVEAEDKSAERVEFAGGFRKLQF